MNITRAGRKYNFGVKDPNNYPLSFFWVQEKNSQGSCLKILFDNLIILMSSKYILALNSKSLKWQLTNHIEVSYHPKMAQVWCRQPSDKP